MAALWSLLAVGACSDSAFTSAGEGDGSGGTTSSGGGTASGGSDGSGGATGVACSDAQVTFLLETNSPDYACLPSPGCGPTWITIRDAQENVYSVDRSCQIDCGSCEPTACPDVECGLVPFDRQVSFAWRGEFNAPGDCTGDRCIQAACAAPGEYIAEICLERAVPPSEGATECIAAGNLECDNVPFTWPPDAQDAAIYTLTVGGP